MLRPLSFRSLHVIGLAACLFAMTGCVDLQSSAAGFSLGGPSGTAAESLRLARLLRDNDRLAAAADIYATMDKKGELGPREVLEYASVSGAIHPPQDALPLYVRAEQQLSSDGRTLGADERLAVCLGIGRGRLALNQLDDAVASFNCALAVDEANIAALNGLGVALTAQGHLADGNQTLTRALDLDPSNVAVQNNLALGKLAAGDSKGAIALLNTEEARANPTLVLNLALAYLLQGNEVQARRALEANFSNIKTAGLVKSLQQLAGRLRAGQRNPAVFLAASLRPLSLETQP